ncbi:MAG: hypothetical protein WDA71_04640 [Actinomycetota bacterium]
MGLTLREWATIFHGIALGGGFLLLFTGAMAGLHGLRAAALTGEGQRGQLALLRMVTSLMAAVAWLTVISGTWVINPWYRSASPTSPRSILVANPTTRAWHEFAFRLKEHIGWFSPILATVVAFVVAYYGSTLVNNNQLRRALMVLLSLAFVFATVAALFGALVSKVAPVQ